MVGSPEGKSKNSMITLHIYNTRLKTKNKNMWTARDRILLVATSCFDKFTLSIYIFNRYSGTTVKEAESLPYISSGLFHQLHVRLNQVWYTTVYVDPAIPHFVSFWRENHFTLRKIKHTSTIVASSDGTLLELHNILCQCTRLVRKDVLDLTKLLIQGGGSSLSRV